MNIERNLIISILKLTRNGPVLTKLVNKDANVPSEVAEKLLRKLQSDGLIYLHEDILSADSLQRLKLAACAIQSGADVEGLSSFLLWKEFEEIATLAFQQNGYNVTRNFRFKYAGRRWEIDVVGCKKPLVICVDCKHWHHGMYPSALRKIAEAQVERTLAFSKALPNFSDKLACACWEKAMVVPAVLSLVPARFKFYDNVPIVAVLQLQDFLSQLPAYASSLKHFQVLANKLNSCS